MNDSISELTQSRKDKINSKDITEIFLFSLFDSSVMSQIAERLCTLRSLIDRGCGVLGGLEKYQKVIYSRVVKKCENFNSQGEDCLLNCFFLSFFNH